MSNFDVETFAETGAGASLTFPEQASSVKKGGHVVIKGRPCKVTDISSSKTGKHGHAKVNVTAVDIFTQKKYEEVCPASHNLDVPVIDRSEYQLIDLEAGFMSLMSATGEMKDDVKAPEGELGEKIRAGFDAGKDMIIAVIKAMNEESAIAAKEAPKGFI
ncbi:MAG: translation initiation factor eIF5A [Amphiamblys sp. WSBS2006]|nr:MAG: translation initiation factor eIF5A [Amphiamblys sp. WSBS2006]